MMDSKNLQKNLAHTDAAARSSMIPASVKSNHLKGRIFPLLMTLLAFNTAWWHYSDINLDISQLFVRNSTTWLILLYTVMIALAFFASFSQNSFKFSGLVLTILSGLPILFIGNRLDSRVAELLLLISAFLLLLQIHAFNLKSVYGMLAFSFMAGAAIPTAIFCLQNGHVNRAFLYSLIPLSMTFAFFLTPIFVPKGLLKSVLSMLIGLALIIYTLTEAVNVWFFLNLLVLLVTWAIFINLKLKAKYHLSIYLTMMFLSILFLTAQMSL
ncbi:MAG: hypothetical protein ABF460_07595 [Oenococcus sp.]|uniref:hypothetical protein n=2 Tax=Lactobacillaceae TaxID=33958 RepID=UPI0039EA6413